MSTAVPFAGLLVAGAAAACFEVSYGLQALETRAVGGPPGPSAGLLARLARRRLFAAAIVLGLAGYGLQVLALSLAPLTVVQPVLALGLVLLLFLGVRLLGERVGPRELAGVAAIVTGVTAIAIAAPARETGPEVGASLVVALMALGLLTAIPLLLARRGWTGGVALAAGAGAADALAALAARLISDELSAGRPLAALGWATLAGTTVLVGLACELSALQQLPVARVAPLVLGIQIAVPVALAPAVAGEQWGSTPLGGAVLVAGLVTVTGGAVALAASASLSELQGGGQAGGGARLDEVEHQASRQGQ